MINEIYLENTNIDRNSSTGKYHSKFYQMVDNNDNTWTATWGKIGALNPQNKIYPKAKWPSLLEAKLVGGYEHANVTAKIDTTVEDKTFPFGYDVDKYNKVKNSIDELMKIISNYAPENNDDAEYKERETDLEAVSNIRKGVISDKKCSKDTLKYLLMLHNQYGEK